MMQLLHPSYRDGPLLEGKSLLITMALVMVTWAVALIVGAVAWAPVLNFIFVKTSTVAPIAGEREWQLVEIVPAVVLGIGCMQVVRGLAFDFYTYAGRRLFALNHWYPTLRRKVALMQCSLVPVAAIASGVPLIAVWLMLESSERFRYAIGSHAHIGSIMMMVASMYGYSQGWVRDSKNSPKGPAPRVDELAVPQEAVSHDFVVAHLSDLHITDGGETLEGKKAPQETLKAIIEQQGSVLASADVVLLTGDLTDAGHPAEWDQFFHSMPKSLLEKAVLVPGNHDVAIVSKNFRRIEDADGRSRSQRYIRMISAMSLVQGPRAFVTDRSNKICTLADFLAPYTARMNDFMSGKPAPVRLRRWKVQGELLDMRQYLDAPEIENVVHAVWRMIFPMAVLSSDRKMVVYIFDTTDFALSIFGNAYGRAAKGAPAFMTAKLDRLRAEFKNCATIYAMHHHLMPPAGPALGGKWFGIEAPAKAAAMVLVDAEETYEAIRKGGRSVVFHGHHHVNYMRQYGKSIQVVGASSTTLGDELNRTRGAGFYLYGISRTNKRGPGTRLVSARFFAMQRS